MNAARGGIALLIIVVAPVFLTWLKYNPDAFALPEPTETETLTYSMHPSEKPLLFVQGRVIDSNNAGAAGVTVTMRQVTRTGPCPEAHYETQTDAEGNFRFRNLPLIVDYQKAEYRYFWQLEAVSEAGQAKLRLQPLHDRRSIFVLLQLQPSPSPRAYGYVLDPAGKPSEKAAIHQFLHEPAYTDHKGYFALPLTRPHTHELFFHTKEGDWGYQRIDPTTSMPVTVQLQSGSQVEGRVVDPRGRGVGGVLFTTPHSLAQQQVITDAQGNFRFEGVPVGPFNFSQPYREQHWVTSRNGYSVLVPESPKIAQVEITAMRGASVQGQVVDRQTATGVPNIRVTADNKAYSSQSRDGITDADGVFRIVGLREGPHEVKIDFDSKTKIPKQQVQTRVGKTVPDLRFEVEVLRLSGTVRDANGQPASQAFVQVSSNHYPSHRQLLSTEDDGTFCFHIPQDIQRLYLQALRDATISAIEGPLELPADNITLRLEPFASLEGQVVNAAGEPFDGARAVLSNNSDLSGKLSWKLYDSADNVDNGYFHYWLPPGSYSAHATYQGKKSPVIQLTLQPGEARKNVRLQIDAALGAIKGEVRFKGEPATGCRIRAHGSGSTVSDANGAFTFDRLVTDSYYMTFQWNSPQGWLYTQEKSIFLKEGETAHPVFELSDDTGSLKGRVWHNGAPCDDAQILLEEHFTSENERWEVPRRYEIHSDANGYYTFDSIPEDYYDLYLKLPPYHGRNDGDVHISAGETVTQDLTIETGTLEIQVAGMPEGHSLYLLADIRLENGPFRHLDEFVWYSQSAYYRELITDNGTVRIDDFLTGSYPTYVVWLDVDTMPESGFLPKSLSQEYTKVDVYAGETTVVQFDFHVPETESGPR